MALLVRNVVNRQSVFVVTIADVTAVILLVRAAIFDALSIVYVAVLVGAARAVRVGNIIDVDVDQTRSAGTATRLSADSDGISELFILRPVSERTKSGSRR